MLNNKIEGTSGHDAVCVIDYIVTSMQSGPRIFMNNVWWSPAFRVNQWYFPISLTLHTTLHLYVNLLVFVHIYMRVYVGGGGENLIICINSIVEGQVCLIVCLCCNTRLCKYRGDLCFRYVSRTFHCAFTLQQFFMLFG